MYWTGENRIQNTDLVQTSRFTCTAFNANSFGTCKMRRLNRALILSFICVIIHISINCKQQDDNFLRSFMSFFDLQAVLACLTIIQNEKK